MKWLCEGQKQEERQRLLHKNDPYQSDIREWLIYVRETELRERRDSVWSRATKRAALLWGITGWYYATAKFLCTIIRAQMWEFRHFPHWRPTCELEDEGCWLIKETCRWSCKVFPCFFFLGNLYLTCTYVGKWLHSDTVCGKIFEWKVRLYSEVRRRIWQSITSEILRKIATNKPRRLKWLGKRWDAPSRFTRVSRSLDFE